MITARATSTTKDKVYRDIRRSIIMHHRKPGDRLDVEQLAAEYGTSITPIRDALHMLSQEGLVTIKPRSGCFVAVLTLKQLKDLLDLRGILELASIERAAQRITPAQIRELEGVHAGYTGDDEESYDRYTEENRQFHYLIARASGNDELAELLRRLHDRLARYMVLRRGGLLQHHTHQRIIEALRAGEVEDARKAMLDEINETRHAVLEHVMQENASGWQVGAGRKS